jgi:diacylglycerol O-acyltransferase / wax synthase
LHSAADIGFNPAHVSHSRAIASLTLPLADVRDVARAFGGTVNDVLLATVAGALRHTLEPAGVDPHAFANVRVMVPVSRHQGDGDTSGNRLAMLVLPLPVDEVDPSVRLARVIATTADLKARHVAEGGDLIAAAPPWLLAGVLSFAVWNRAFNLIVTNVPGPRERMHVADATVTRMVPIVNLWPHVGVGIAATTYADQLDISVHVDFDAVPGFLQLRDELARSFAALRRVVA